MPIWLALFALLVCVPLDAEPPSVAHKSTWHYGVEWRLVRAGAVRLTWSPEALGFSGELDVQSTGLVSKLYRVNDEYRSLMNDQLCASTVTITAEEGKRRRDTEIRFGHEKATYLERDLVKNTVVLSKETPVPDCVHEYIGGLQVMRTRPPELGQSIQVPLSDGKKAANVRVEAQEREEIFTPLGKFQAVRYEVQIFNDVLISRKARLYVWLTDDERRLPVQIRVRMQFLVGTIDLKLEKVI